MPADGNEVRRARQSRLTRLETIPGDLAERGPLPANANAHSRIDKIVLALPEAKRIPPGWAALLSYRYPARI
jgi:hypothetical protein